MTIPLTLFLCKNVVSKDLKVPVINCSQYLLVETLCSSVSKFYFF